MDKNKKALVLLGFMGVAVAVAVGSNSRAPRPTAPSKISRDVLDTSGFPSSPIERARVGATRAMQMLGRLDPKGEVQDYFRGMSPEEVAQRTGELSNSGLRLLSDSMLVARYQLLQRAFANSDPSQCDAMVSRPLTGQESAELIGALPAPDVLKWYEITSTALVKAVQGRNQRAASSPEDEAATLMLLEQYVPESDRARFVRAHRELASLSLAESCWLRRITFETVAQVSGPEGHRIRTALATWEARSLR